MLAKNSEKCAKISKYKLAHTSTRMQQLQNIPKQRGWWCGSPPGPSFLGPPSNQTIKFCFPVLKRGTVVCCRQTISLDNKYIWVATFQLWHTSFWLQIRGNDCFVGSKYFPPNYPTEYITQLPWEILKSRETLWKPYSWLAKSWIHSHTRHTHTHTLHDWNVFMREVVPTISHNMRWRNHNRELHEANCISIFFGLEALDLGFAFVRWRRDHIRVVHDGKEALNSEIVCFRQNSAKCTTPEAF